MRSAALKPIAHLCVWAAVGLSTVLAALLPDSVFADDELVPPCSISGRLANRQGGPMYGTVYAAVWGSETYYSDEADANGNYSITGIPTGAHVLVYLYNVNPYFSILSDPEAKDRYVYSNLVGEDFLITPGVVVVLNAGSWLVSYRGVEVFCGWTRVASMDEFSNGMAVFYPDLLGLPYSGTIWFARPFYEFRPQDSQHVYSHYDCGSHPLTEATNYQTPYAKTDVPAAYSWDDPGGLGWRYFPATPDDRLPNNPNVHVSAHFYTSGTLPRTAIRLVGPGMPNGILADADLTDANGHVAEFNYPINDCSRRNLRVQVLFQYGYSDQWTELPDYVNSGTSNGDLSPNIPPDPPAIDTADLAALAATYGKCQGDTGYNPCADYQPDNCVNMSDLPLFSTIYYWNQNKSSRSIDPSVSVRLEEQPGVALGLAIQSDASWAAAAIRLRLADHEEGEVRWEASRDFDDRAIMVANESTNRGEYVVFVLTPGQAGATNIGSLVAGNGRSEPRVEIVSVDLAKLGDDEKMGSGGAPIVAALADAKPNPFNPLTKLAFELPTAEVVSVSVFDLAGRLIRRLVDRQLLVAGPHSTTWDGRDDSGFRMAGGVYLYVLESPTFRLSKRMTLLK